MADILVHSDAGPPVRTVSIVAAWLAFSLGAGWVAANPREDNPADFLPQPAQDFTHVDPGYAPEQMVWVVPLIKQIACTRAVGAVKYQLRPAELLASVCGVEDHTELADNLIDVVVSGAVWNETVKHPFKVTLQHYPSRLNVEGYIIRSIDIR